MGDGDLNEIIYEPKGRSYLKFFILAGGILAVILIVIIFLFILNKFSPISEKELLIGKTFKLEKGEKIDFVVNEEIGEHCLTVDSITLDSVTITLQSRKIILIFKIGEEKKIDINGDGVYDLQIKLEKIEDKKSYFNMKKIEEPSDSGPKDISHTDDEKSCAESGGIICKVNQQCTVELKEIKGEQCCLGNCFFPEVNQEVNETPEGPCIEDWACGEWGSCAQLLQTRTCSDNNACGTDDDKPVISKSCNETSEPSGGCSDSDAKEISDSIMDTIKNKEQTQYEEICELYGNPCFGWGILDFRPLEIYNISFVNIADEENFNRKWVWYSMDGPVTAIQFIFNLSDNTCFQFDMQYSPA